MTHNRTPARLHRAAAAPRILLTLCAALFLVISPLVGAPMAAKADDTSFHYIYMPAIFKARLEWTLHKTSDGQHPDGNEQQMLWLMNRARANPAQEGLWLATTDEGDIAFPRSYFGVNTDVLQSEFNGYAAKPPAAFDARMYAGSKAHSDDLIARDTQDHNGQFERVSAAGFSCWGGRASVFAYADSSLNAHGGFNIDWGSGDNGMQTSRGHRAAIMSIDGDYTNFGIAMVPAPDGKRVGPLVTSAVYCYANTSKAGHFNRFIIGTVWQDNNGNSRYDPGEGYSGVSVNPDHGDYYAVTSAGGGYAIPVANPGQYVLTFAGAVTGQARVTVGNVSVLADLQVPAGAAPSAAANGVSIHAARATGHSVQAPPPGIAR